MALFDIEFPEKQFYSMAGMPSEKVIETLAEEQNKEVPVLRAMDLKEEQFLENLGDLEPLEYSVNIARALFGVKPMAVASGGTLPVVSAQLQHLEIIELFDTIVTAEHTEKHKPEPDVFLEAADRLKVLPKNCIVFEDGDLGIEAARRAEMDVIDVRQYYPDR